MHQSMSWRESIRSPVSQPSQEPISYWHIYRPKKRGGGLKFVRDFIGTEAEIGKLRARLGEEYIIKKILDY
jgi:hypothetical protein